MRKQSDGRQGNLDKLRTRELSLEIPNLVRVVAHNDPPWSGYHRFIISGCLRLADALKDKNPDAAAAALILSKLEAGEKLPDTEFERLLTLADNLQPTAKAGAAPGKAEVPWTDNAPEYLPNSEAVKLAEGRLEVKELYRLLTPDGAIHYMRKGHRGKVHLQDFRRYLTNRPDLESDITELPAELVDKALSGIATRKAKIDKQRQAR